MVKEKLKQEESEIKPATEEKTDFSAIEKKWQKEWGAGKIFEVKEDSKKKKCYVLEMFPYPSASGLHMGHALNYTIGDIFARFKRMKGFNVLYPMGYDAFGLPAENAAIKAREHPKKYTEMSMSNFEKQQRELGLSYDWKRMVKTCDPEYYKWNQYFFLKFMEKGLVYRKKSAVNWCPKCDTVLANEQVHSGKCWRHEDTNVEIKHLEQWFIKTTAYSEELLEKVDSLKWPERIKIMQKNWIGKSYGIEIDFEILHENEKIINVENVEHFRNNISIDCRLKIKNKEFSIREIVKFRFDDGSYYTKLFLDNDYVLADDLGGNSFILVKEVKTNLNIKKNKINFEGKNFDFAYNAHTIAEETYGEQIFPKGNSESFWDYTSKDGSYLSLGIIDKTKKRLDFAGEIIYSKDIKILKKSEKWPIFTTRPDTIYGVTFMVISSQHPKLFDIVTDKQKKEVESFLKKMKSVSEKEMKDMEKEGVFTGSYAINPLTKEKVPVYAGNFVVADYGSGMVMAVPTHDQRDFEFAKKYKIPLKVVIQNKENNLNEKTMKYAYTEEGTLVNSDKFNGLNSKKAIEELSNYIEKQKLGKKTVNYKFRDWLVSRQRYWGTPIPIIYCDKCGAVPVNEKDLPVLLPEKIEFGKGNPLLTNKEFVNAKCPKCGKNGKRETDTMDTFFDSSWYYLRYCDNKNSKEAFNKNKVKYWMPVDQYIGGAEHACMHLIYARFFTKALRDMGLLNFDEPFPSLFNQGMLHGTDGNKMSKSLGNVINPDEVSKKYGMDTARLFLMSQASPDKDTQWNENGIEGSLKIIKKIFSFFQNIKTGKSSARAESKLNKTIKEVTEDIENFRYNLGIIKLRSLFEVISNEKEISKKDIESFLKLLHPFCPHITEELWHKLGNKTFLSLEPWPIIDESKIDEKLEKQEEQLDKLISDIRNILNILETKGEKQGKSKIKIFAIPNELELYSKIGNKIKTMFDLDAKILSIKDAKLEGKEIKASPGKPGIFIE